MESCAIGGAASSERTPAAPQEPPSGPPSLPRPSAEDLEQSLEYKKRVGGSLTMDVDVVLVQRVYHACWVDRSASVPAEPSMLREAVAAAQQQAVDRYRTALAPLDAADGVRSARIAAALWNRMQASEAWPADAPQEAPATLSALLDTVEELKPS